MLTDYSSILNFLYGRLPMFSRIGNKALKKGLNNITELCHRLHQPHQKFRSIHVGGTNGKGSTSHMLAAILQTAGYKTGLYTSPHLVDFRERIRINGEMISEEEVIHFIQQQQQNMADIQPSFFEVTVAMAFDHFARHKVDIAVIEVGLGGRLDSTNIIHPLVSVITNISYDHVAVLGNTLPKIATEKAGIIKQNTPLVIGQKQPEVEQIFKKKVQETESAIVFASEEWNIEEINTNDAEFLELYIKSNTQPLTPYTLKLDLTGSYQTKNLATVLSTVQQLQKQHFNITHQHIVEALQKVQKLTGLQGRWQRLSNNPLTICDTGHNEDGIRQVVVNIKKTPHKNLHIVLGMVKDKDSRKILSLLPQHATYYFCAPQIERAKPVNELASEAQTAGLTGRPFPSVASALQAAKNHAQPEDLIFVGGSTFVVAEILQIGI